LIVLNVVSLIVSYVIKKKKL